MNSDSPGESEIISTRAATIWKVFRVGQNKKERSSGWPKGSLGSGTLRLMIHSKFAEAAPHAVLSQVPQDRTRVLFCTRWTGATSCRHLMQQFVELAPLARPQRM